MKNRGRLGKRILVYTAAAALVLSAAGAGSSFVSQADYIQYDNIVIRDKPETGNIIEGVDAGTEVTVLSTTKGSDGRPWNQVRFTVDGAERVGWVRADLMNAKNPNGETVEKAEETQTNQPQESQTNQQQTSQTQENQTNQQQVSQTQENQTEQQQANTQQTVSGDGYVAGDDGTFLIGNKKLKISGDFPDSTIPDGFSKKTVTYNGQNVNMIKYDKGDLYLVWLSDGHNGEFYVLDTVRNCVIPFMQKKSGNETVTLLLPPQNSKVSSAYENTVLMSDNSHGVTAFHPTEKQGVNENLDLAQFYYVYGMSSNGTAGWYLFDSGSNTFVRAVEDMSVEDAAKLDPAQSHQEISIKKMVFLSIIVVFLIILFAAIALGMKCRRLAKQIPENMDDDDDLDEQFMTVSERRREQNKYRHIMDDTEKEGEKEAEVSEETDEQKSLDQVNQENGQDISSENNQLANTDFAYDWPVQEEPSDEKTEELSDEKIEKKPTAEEIDQIAADLADLYPDGKIPEGPGYYNEPEEENPDSLQKEDEEKTPDEPNHDAYEKEQTKEEKHKERRIRRKKKKDSDDDWDDVLEFLDLK